MATARLGQQENGYQNWLRGSVALLYLKEGIESFIDKRVFDLHEELHTTIPQPYSRQASSGMKVCTTCTHYDIQKHKNTWRISCRSNVCSTWMKHIMRYHVGGDVAYTNLKPQLWPSDPWEVAKWFLPVGCENVKSARDADVAAILKLLKNCLFIDTYMNNSTLVEEVLRLRHEYMHSSDLTVTDDKLRQDTGKIIDMLKSLDRLTNTEIQYVQRAIDNITKLQFKTMNMPRDKEVATLHSRMQAVDSELANLRGKCIDYDKTRQDLSKTEQKLKSLNGDYTKTKTEIKQLVESKEKFEKFLHDNGLVQDIARLSVKLQEYDQNLNQQDQRTEYLGQRMNEQAQRLDQQEHKADNIGQKIDEQVQRLDQQEHKTDHIDQQMEEQGQRLDKQEHKTYHLCQQIDEQKHTNEHLGQQMDKHENKTYHFGQRMDEHIQRIDEQGQRLDQQTHTTDNLCQQMDEQGQRLDQQEHKTNHLGQQMDEHAQKILTLAEQVMPKPDVPVAGSSRSWNDKCKDTNFKADDIPTDLQAVLMSHYKHSCVVIQNPLENNDVGLECMYVAPDIKVLRESMGRDGLGNVKEKVTSMSCKQVFYTKAYQCKNIYITGDAGTGKTMLCRNIVRLWCEAHGGITVVESEESESDSDEDDVNMLERRQARGTRHEERKRKSKEDRQILSQFKLLFYITLRDSLSDYRITDMIQSQILQHYDIAEGLKTSELLKNECCLVICDGLDEWVCPEGSHVPHFVNSGIPGRDITIETSVFLTTTRPWKLDVLQLKSSELDKHIALIGISEQSASQLCSKAIKILRKSKRYCKKKEDFFRTLNERGLSHFKEIPVILIQLIFLWFEDKVLPKSQVQLYCDILEHLLEKSKLKIATKLTNIPKDMQSNRPLPECFRDHSYCLTHRQLIYCLSRIAFEALFDETKENSLVFKSSQLEIYGIGQEAIDLCLESGILSQSKVLDKVSVSEKKMSFLHKKLQEFLAALFIAGSFISEGLFKRMFKKSSNKKIKQMKYFCNTLDTCLEMSQVYIFLSGLKQDLTQQLLTHFTHVVTADKQTKIQKYRQSLDGEGLIQAIQTFITDCVVEGNYHGYRYVNICLADFYITKTILCHVKPLFLCAKSLEVNSVCMRTTGIDRDQVTAITSQLQQCHSVQKLYLFDLESYIHVDTVTQIVNNNIDTLTCLHLDICFTATAELVSDICSISSKCLMALGLWRVRLTHEQIEQILTRLPHSPIIRQLYLWLYCTDHDTQCKARIDLSNMTHIHTLKLFCMSVDNLQSVSNCVEHVKLWYVILPVTTLCEFARRLSQTRRHVMVQLYYITVTEVRGSCVDVKTFLRTCHGLKVTWCYHNYSDNTWSIDFSTSSQKSM